jgi:hypothetical protein
MAVKKYQVFISSTFKDLQEERRKILDVLLMADCIPAGMESFVATDDEQFEIIKKVIDLCDYYILLIGKCYGTVNDKTGLSYTEMEYDYAKEQGIPVLVFAIDESIELPEEKKEQNKDRIIALKKFRDNAMSNRLVSIWKNTEELIGKCSISIMKAKNEIERTGWQKATDYDEASLRREIMNLQSDNEELESKLLRTEETLRLFTEQKDVAFEKCDYKFEYKFFDTISRKDTSKTINLKNIFILIAIKMNDVSVNKSSIENTIKNFLERDQTIFFKDMLIIDKILIQLKELGLIYSFWDQKSSNLFWGLTAKGEKARNDEVLKRDNDCNCV